MTAHLQEIGMKYLVFVLSFIAAMAFAQQKDVVVAEIGQKKIMLDDFNKKYNEILNIVGTSGGTAPTKQEFLEDLVRFELGLAEANKKNLEKDPLVQERLKQEMYKVLLEREIGPKAAKIAPSDAD